MNILYAQLIIALAVVGIGNCSTAKENSCDCVCGSQGVRKTIDDKDYPLTNKYPWTVGVYNSFQEWGYLCSGSLISNKHVLISAKCGKLVIIKRDKYGDSIEIRLGDNVNNTVRRGLFTIYQHENYNHSDPDFDISILQMDHTVSFGVGIQPICLPESTSVDYSEKSAIVNGWYDLYPSVVDFYYAQRMLKSQNIRVPIWTNKDCEEIPHYTGKLTNNMICAGAYEDETRHPCVRDVENDQIFIERKQDSMELVGIFSFGTRCGTVGVPAVYTRVANFVPWIRSKIKGCICATKNING